MVCDKENFNNQKSKINNSKHLMSERNQLMMRDTYSVPREAAHLFSVGRLGSLGPWWPDTKKPIDQCPFSLFLSFGRDRM